jgi:alkanesulfonate monooxygenase SsuD/methylene tetrahydromethanopterin reductase-like flavin-dependent oxidoreductase (luciferase family)
MELASNAHHVFRFTFEGKRVPPELVEPIRRVQRGYQPRAHEQLGASANAALLEAEPALARYLADRFAVVGPPAACVERLRAAAQAGIANFLFTGFVPNRPRLIRALGEEVLPHLV